MPQDAHDTDVPATAAPATNAQAPAGEVPQAVPLGVAAPSRYQTTKAAGGRYLFCANASNLQLHVDRKTLFDASNRRACPPNTIFLDGACGGPPFIDNKARQYNLDHHSDCVRNFTLSTCEQAAVLILEGIPLSEGTWHIHVNDPDLDALLAAWVLLNHREMLRHGHELLRVAMPLIRIEGVIDAHGLDKDALTGLADDRYAAYQAMLDELRQPELDCKDAGRWETMDELAYTREILDRVDRLFLTDSYLGLLLEVEELCSVPLEDQKIAVACRAQRGIYHAERVLADRYGKQLGVVLLDKGNGHFTLRQSDVFLHSNLDAVYRRLNNADRNADRRQFKTWGGSSNIGGSPRGVGSALGVETILHEVREAYRQRGVWGTLRGWIHHRS